MITAAQDMQIKAALGPDVLRVTQQIDCAMESGLGVPVYLWRELPAALKRPFAGSDEDRLWASVHLSDRGENR